MKTDTPIEGITDVVTLREITRRSYPWLRLPDRFQDFIGYVPAEHQFNVQLYGGKGSGKSTFALELASVLARHGRVLYVSAEERPDAGTIRIRARYLGISSPDIDLLDTSNVFDAERTLRHHQQERGKPYRFCFVDSVNVMKEGDIAALALRDSNPNTSFVFINQVNSEGEARGSRVVGHSVDIVIGFRVDGDGSRMAINVKNRYGATESEMLVFRAATPASTKKAATWEEMEPERMAREAKIIMR